MINKELTAAAEKIAAEAAREAGPPVPGPPDGPRLNFLKLEIIRGRRGSFYSSAEWRRTRAAVMQRARNECQLCRARGIYTAAFEVHHISPIAAAPARCLDACNLIALCSACHDAIHAPPPGGPPERW